MLELLVEHHHGREMWAATGPYVNFFLDKDAISHQVLTDVIAEKTSMVSSISVKVAMLPSICQVQTLPNHSQLVTYVQRLSVMLLPIFMEN